MSEQPNARVIVRYGADMYYQLREVSRRKLSARSQSTSLRVWPMRIQPRHAEFKIDRSIVLERRWKAITVTL